jgi:opacity protein-like surface antigen
MKYALAVVFSLIAVMIAPTWAQQDQDQGQASRIELYGGYDYIRFNINASPTVLQPPSETFNANGGGGQFVYNVNNWLGVLGDVSGYRATNSIKSGAAMPYLFGPRANLHRGKITPFAQVIVGGILTSGGIQTFGWQNHFAMAVGGGLDVRVSRHISLRPLEAEYFLTKIPDGLNNRQNNFRAGAGIAFRFG